MTLMDKWLVICILYVVMELMEYTVLLYILLTDDEVNPEGEKESKILMCRRIDSWARKGFLALNILMLGAYSYVVMVNI